MYKYFNDDLPDCFNNYFREQPANNHGYNLRRRNINHQTISPYSEKMIKNNGIAIWNTIPEDIKSCTNIKSFSSKLKTDIILVKFQTDFAKETSIVTSILNI